MYSTAPQELKEKKFKNQLIHRMCNCSLRHGEQCTLNHGVSIENIL